MICPSLRELQRALGSNRGIKQGGHGGGCGLVVRGRPWMRNQHNKLNKLGVRIGAPSNPGRRVVEAASVERRPPSSGVRQA